MKNLRRLLPALAVAFAVLFSASEMSAQTNKIDKQRTWQELLSFKNQNLFEEKSSKLREKADKLLNKIVFQGKELDDREKFPFWGVRYVWETGKNKYAVMESLTLIMLPGQQIHNFYFFDENGNLLNKEDFSTGWRMLVNSVELIKNDDFEFPVIKIKTWGGGGFAYAVNALQYYALLEESVVLIRLESKGNSIFNLDNRNSYGCEYPSIGPKMPERSAKKWAESLNSENKAEILRTLMWLAGKHETIEELNEDQKNQEEVRKRNPELGEWKTTLEKCPEIIREIQTYESVKKRQDVQKRLQELTRSSNRWIAEAAELALKPIGRRKGY